MYILGINTGHDSGAALINDNEIIAAINEERLSRIKMHHGFPYKSIKEVLSIANISFKDLDVIAIEGKHIMPQSVIGFESGDSDWKKVLIGRLGIESVLLGTKIGLRLLNIILLPATLIAHRKIKKWFKNQNFSGRFEFVDHHYAHAATAYYTQSENGLAITLDANGEGFCSKVYRCHNDGMEFLHCIPGFHSPAYYYAYVTKLLGFKPLRHEGKITGLAAYGNPNEVVKILESFINLDASGLSFSNQGGFHLETIKNLKLKLNSFCKEDIAAGIQSWTEKIVSEYVSSIIKIFGSGKGENIFLAGGMFANVKINQNILENANVNNIYIFPNMGDGGLGLGAALTVIKKRLWLDHVYLGRFYSDGDIEKELLKSDVKYHKSDNIAYETALALSNEKIVARFSGRMEYGPRALGNRSILCSPTNNNINDSLNQRLNRTEFMPFAPVVRDVDYQDYFVINGDTHPYEFMTITCEVTDVCEKVAPAITHIDKTARPQIISRKNNPNYYDILTEYKSLTGVGVLVNTSFNVHEEPIVNTPSEAIDTFIKSGLDVLSIGGFYVKR